MTQTNNSNTQTDHTGPLAQSMLLGAGIALIVISFFVFGADEPKREWGKLWMARPLIITPLAGAVGGAFYYLLNRLSLQGRLNPATAVILSVVIYLIGLWMGIVLGLDGTMWD